MRVIGITVGVIVYLSSECFASTWASQHCPDDIHYAPDYFGHTLACGATFHGTNGISFDSQDRLHVTNLISHEIHTLDPLTGDLLETIGFADGVITPDDCIVGPEDQVYWTGFMNGLIGRRRITGETDTIAQLSPGVNGLVLSDSGLLYVNNYLTGEIYELDPEAVTPPRVVAVGPLGLEAMDIGPDGDLYMPSIATGSVYRVDIETGTVTEVQSGYSDLTSVAFDSKGTMYFAQATGTIYSALAPYIENAQVFTQFNSKIESLGFDSQDRMYISDSAEGYLYRVYNDGTYRSILRPGLAVGGGLGIVGRGFGISLYVADIFTLKEYSPFTGRLRNSWMRGVSDPLTELSHTFTVSAYGRNELLVTSWFDNTVQVWDPRTNTVSSTYFDFDVPINAIEVDGAIVVSELGSGTVSLRPAGTELRTVIAEGLYAPAGLAANRHGDVWVSDWASGMIWQIMAQGLPITATPVAYGLVKPEGMAVGRDGKLIVIESGAHRLVEVDPSTGALSIIASNLPVGIPAIPDTPPTWVFNGVATDIFGAVYVSLDAQNQLIKIWPLR